jgi:hypothetical protein
MDALRQERQRSRAMTWSTSQLLRRRARISTTKLSESICWQKVIQRMTKVDSMFHHQQVPLITPHSDYDVPYTEIEAEIEDAGNAYRNETETERSEHYPTYTLILFQIIMLIFRTATARQRRQVIRLLANSEIGRLFHFAADDDEFATILIMTTSWTGISITCGG